MKYIIQKALILYCLLFISYTAYAQNSTENYVQETTYLDSTKVSDPAKRQIRTVQYFDGLGRPKQIVNVKASPQGKDLVTPIIYDNLGRQTRQYLPVPQSSTTNGQIYTQTSGMVPFPVADGTGIYSGEKIYTEKQMESSPMDRVLQQTGTGNDWVNKPLIYGYSANTQSDNVKKYETTTAWDPANKIYTSTLQQTTSYSAGQLYKNTVTDEDGNITIEFQNGAGQIIVSRKVLDSGTTADTYYVYNEYNKLAFVIPPLASVITTMSSIDLDNLCYQYKYDSEDRMVEKKLPGKGWEFMVYDQQDRLVLSQDANLRTTTNNNFGAKGWMFTKYDQLDREVYTGFFTNASTRVDMQTALNNAVANAGNNETRSVTPFSLNYMDVYYTTDAFPTGNLTILTVNYYDTYPPSLAYTIPDTTLNQNVLKQPGQTASARNTNGLLLSTYLKNIEDDNWTRNYNWYDTKGRVIGAYSMNHLGGDTTTETEYDFAGAVKKTVIRHKRLRTDVEKVITETYTYDGQNRLLVHNHQVGNGPVEILAQNSYNELSQLTNKKVGNNLQNIDYTYNIRGWMTRINNPSNLNGKLFGYEMKYQSPVNTSLSTGKYNGNIAEIDWQTSQDGVLKRYSYQYDPLNRLKKGLYSEPGAFVPENGFFNEEMSYDLNGNITALRRQTKGTAGAEQIDNLTYQYLGTNRLKSVTDDSQNYLGYPDVSGTPIEYDTNGNMTSHLDKGILNIDYNFLNLPKKITFNQTYIVRNTKGVDEERNVRANYTYRADGTKLRKGYTAFFSKFGAERTTTTDYLDGFQYTVNYLNAATLEFVPTSEGYFNFKDNTYIYNYTDHLGNVRLSYFKNANSSAEVIEENNYYPFGLKHNAYNSGNGNPAYKYGYNGKELQEETGMYDYGARFYMPDVGRWGVVDELAEKSRRFSTYTYALDNPILFVDPDGREAEQCCKKQLNWATSYAKGAWSTAGSLAKGAVTSTYTGITGGIKEAGKVYNAYQKGGAKAAGNQYLKSVYETSGAKGLVDTGSKAIKGDPQALGSLATIGVAALITHKAGGSKGAASTEATMSELTNTVKSTASEMYASKKAPAAVVGAELNGQTTIGVSGAPPSTIAPQLEGVVNELGGLGTRTASGNPVGCCAEFNAGNQLLLNNPSATPGQINFTDAIRPRTGKVVPMCNNCKTTFEK